MAFFGLTQLGYQNSFRESSRLSKGDPLRKNIQLGFVALPPLKDCNAPARSILPVDQVSSWGPGPDGSYVELVRLKRKHTRNSLAPTDMYRFPPTMSSQYGWWMVDHPIREKHPWIKGPHHPQIQSEMSRFLNDMQLTDRQFSLF